MASLRTSAETLLYKKNSLGQTPLHTAAKRGNTDVVRLYLNMGAIRIVQDRSGRIPLHLAVQNQHGPMVEVLLKGRSNWERPKRNYEQRKNEVSDITIRKESKLLEIGSGLDDGDWLYTLREPARETTDWEERAREIEWVEKERSTEMRNDKGATALHLAVESKGYEVIKKLLSCGSSANVLDSTGKTAIYWAAKEDGNEEIIALLIEEYANIDQLNYRQVEAALKWAIEQDRKKMAERLLENNADVKTKYKNALRWIVSKKRKDMLLLLLSKEEADVDTEDGQRALLWVVQIPCTKAVRILCTRMKEQHSSKALCSAVALPKGLLYRNDSVFHDRDEVIGILLDLGVGITAKDDGKTALYRMLEQRVWWSYERFTEMIKEFLDAGADANAEYDGKKILHLAVSFADTYEKSQKKVVNVIESLLKAGAEIDAECRGKTALYMAVEQDRWRVVEKLVKSDANFKGLRFKGETILQRAIECDEQSWEERRPILMRLLPYMRGILDEHPESGTMLLHHAIASDAWEIVELLVRYGVDPQVMENSEDSPLNDENRELYEEAVRRASRAA